MAENSKIEWTHHTFNPWRGCAKVSPGCAHCYAEQMAGRNPGALGTWGPGGVRVIASEAYWRQPRRWDREAAAAGVRRRVFCASLADFCEERPELVEPRRRLFELIGATPHLDWLLLTKRPEVAVQHWPLWAAHAAGGGIQAGLPPPYPMELATALMIPNVWVGVSVEDRLRWRQRVPLLKQIPAAIRFVSIEPLLEDLGNIRGDLLDVPLPAYCVCGHGHGFSRCPNTGGISQGCHVIGCGCPGFRKRPGPATGIHWLIVGGESGAHARPFDVAWARSILAQGRQAGASCFFKQLGSYPVSVLRDGDDWPEGTDCLIEGLEGQGRGCHLVGRITLRDRKGGTPAEWPEAIRVRQFPDEARPDAVAAARRPR